MSNNSESPKFKVILSGVRADVSPLDASAKLAALFKTTPEQIDKLLTNPGYVIKKGLDANIATKYKRAIEAAGWTCQIAQENVPEKPFVVDTPQENSSAQVPPAKPSSEAKPPAVSSQDAETRSQSNDDIEAQRPETLKQRWELLLEWCRNEFMSRSLVSRSAVILGGAFLFVGLAFGAVKLVGVRSGQTLPAITNDSPLGIQCSNADQTYYFHSIYFADGTFIDTVTLPAMENGKIKKGGFLGIASYIVGTYSRHGDTFTSNRLAVKPEKFYAKFMNQPEIWTPMETAVEITFQYEFTGNSGKGHKLKTLNNGKPIDIGSEAEFYTCGVIKNPDYLKEFLDLRQIIPQQMLARENTPVPENKGSNELTAGTKKVEFRFFSYSDKVPDRESKPIYLGPSTIKVNGDARRVIVLHLYTKTGDENGAAQTERILTEFVVTCGAKEITQVGRATLALIESKWVSNDFTDQVLAGSPQSWNIEPGTFEEALSTIVCPDNPNPKVALDKAQQENPELQPIVIEDVERIFREGHDEIATAQKRNDDRRRQAADVSRRAAESSLTQLAGAVAQLEKHCHPSNIQAVEEMLSAAYKQYQLASSNKNFSFEGVQRLADGGNNLANTYLGNLRAYCPQ